MADTFKTPPPPPSSSRAGRVPSALQAVFLASCRGMDVIKPPPEACKTFRGRFFFQRKAKSSVVPTKPRATVLRPGLFFRRKAKKSNRGHQEDVATAAAAAAATEHTSSRQDCETVSISEISIADTIKTSSALSAIPQDTKKEDISAQDYLDSIMKSRGHSTQRFDSLDTAYRNDPTPLQLASYNVYLINLVRKGDTEAFRALFKTGISPNPCNAQGESLLHTVCRRDSAEFLRIMLEEAGSTVQVTDDYGRTPLHDACWSASPCFDKIKLLMDRDVHLMQLVDARGASPLLYTRKEHWPEWIKFLDDNKDRYWPDKTNLPACEQAPSQPPLTLLKPNSRPIEDPANALPLAMAAMVAGKRLSPEEALYLREDSDDSDDSEDEDDSDSDYDDESSISDDDESSCSDEDDEEESSSSTWDEEEMANILQTVGLPNNNNRAPSDIIWSNPRPYE